MRHGGAPAAIGLAGPSQTWVSVSASASMRHMGVPRFSSWGVIDMRLRLSTVGLLTCIGDTLHAGAGTYWGAQPVPQHQLGIEGKGGGRVTPSRCRSEYASYERTGSGFGQIKGRITALPPSRSSLMYM